eukprot:2081324-Pyramimonas_sp.AAC.1
MPRHVGARRVVLVLQLVAETMRRTKKAVPVCRPFPRCSATRGSVGMHSEEMAMGLPPRPQTHHAAMRQSQELTYSDVARMPIATLQQVSPMMHSKAMAGIMHANNVFMYQ